VVRPELYVDNILDKKYLLKERFSAVRPWGDHGHFSSA